MSETLTLNAPAQSSPVAVYRKSGTFYEKLVLKSFSCFKYGGLRIMWPDGHQCVVGAPNAEVTAEIHLRRRDAFFQRCALYGDIGFGEAYVEGDWDTDNIAEVVTWFIENMHRSKGMMGASAKMACTNLLRMANHLQHWLRPNSINNSRRNISEHYDLGNDFYALWLDQTMTYSAARFTEQGQSLDDAQFAKYEALCRKLKLKKSDHVLEIGCGWGGFSSYAAKTYGCKITAITISQEQFNYATQRMQSEGLTDHVEIRLQDYRHVTGLFDKIASIEMLEAVGDAYLEIYFAKCSELLKHDGLLAVQMITTSDSHHPTLRRTVDWIQKHIFPGSLLLSVGRANEAMNRSSNLFMHELEDLGASYAKTLEIWFENFNAKLDEVKALGFDDRFIRKWNYYLQYCEAAFQTRNISVVQACYTKPNNPTLRETW